MPPQHRGRRDAGQVENARKVQLPNQHVLVLVLVVAKAPVPHIKRPDLVPPPDAPRLEPAGARPRSAVASAELQVLLLWIFRRCQN